VSVGGLVRPMVPFLAIMFVTMVLLAYVPGLAERIPGAYGG
jgi:TRAP-type C4-dicarboxylate transport system permease large subunit